MNAFTALAAAGRPQDHRLPPLPDDVFDALAAEIIDASDTSHGLQPSGWKRPRRLMQGGAVAAAAAGLLAAGLLAGPAPNAEAQIWSVVPVAADSTRQVDLEASCRDWMDTAAPAVVTELRGSSSYTVLADSSQCLRVGDGAGGGGAGVLWQGTVPADAVLMTATFPSADPTVPPVLPDGTLTVPHTVTPAPVGSDVDLQAAGPVLTVTTNSTVTSEYIAINGRVGPDVKGVVVHRGDAEDVVATVNAGWFAAWWPTSQRPTSITVATTDGSYDRQVQSD